AAPPAVIEIAGRDGGRAAQRLSWRHAQVLNEETGLLCVPFAIGRDGKPRICSCQQLYARLVRFSYILECGLDLGLRRGMPALARAIRRLTVLIGVHHQGEGRANRAAVLEHRIQTLIIHKRRVEDDVCAGPSGVEHRFLTASMGDYPLAQTVGFGDHSRRLFLVEGGDELSAGVDAIRLQAEIAIHSDLDDINAVLYLAANLLDRLGWAADDMPDGRPDLSEPGWIPIS